jgi:capsular exopolysaccharide synthesis family protein
MSEAELLNMIHMHEESGLYILPCGSIPPNPAELLGSESMRRLLTLVGVSFNHVVIDSPPSASFTDAVLVSSLVDGVILVAHGGKTSRNVVRRTRQILRDAGGRILGVVLNNLQVSKHDYYYYQSYYSKDYYSASAGDNA